MKTLFSQVAAVALIFGGTGCVVHVRPRPAIVVESAPPPPPPPPAPVVVYEPAPPPPQVEVVPVAPAPGMVYIRGGWYRERRGWVWHHGYWRY